MRLIVETIEKMLTENDIHFTKVSYVKRSNTILVEESDNLIFIAKVGEILHRGLDTLLVERGVING